MGELCGSDLLIQGLGWKGPKDHTSPAASWHRGRAVTPCAWFQVAGYVHVRPGAAPRRRSCAEPRPLPAPPEEPAPSCPMPCPARTLETPDTPCALRTPPRGELPEALLHFMLLSSAALTRRVPAVLAPGGMVPQHLACTGCDPQTPSVHGASTSSGGRSGTPPADELRKLCLEKVRCFKGFLCSCLPLQLLPVARCCWWPW